MNPGRGFETITPMNADNWMEHLTLLGYRLAGDTTLNLMDDAAMLALIFC